jgi:hypothetical protein
MKPLYAELFSFIILVVTLFVGGFSLGRITKHWSNPNVGDKSQGEVKRYQETNQMFIDAVRRTPKSFYVIVDGKKLTYRLEVSEDSVSGGYDLQEIMKAR